ncbi:MAG: hypothetical protein GY943_26695 [Chloroflexi bacterium]|nr:hypothetical protein [Chloroflexota bacterium]
MLDKVYWGSYLTISIPLAFRWVLWLHGTSAYALVLLIYWKNEIVAHAWRRKKRWTMIKGHGTPCPYGKVTDY